jgi:hypothetical protein
MIPEAVLSHYTRERLRIKVPSKKGNASYFSSLEANFANLRGVTKVEANALTGSLLLIHAVDLKAIAAFAENNGLFKLHNASRRTTALSGNIARTFKDFDTRVKKFTGNEMDVPGIAFIMLVGFGVYEIGRGNFAAPAWYTAFWYALNIFLKSLPDAAVGDNE